MNPAVEIITSLHIFAGEAPVITEQRELSPLGPFKMLDHKIYEHNEIVAFHN